MLFASTTGVCYREGKAPLYIPQGSLVYIPKNSRYMWENSPAFENRALENLLLEFEIKNIAVTKEEKDYKKIIVNPNLADEYISFSNDVTIVGSNRFAVYQKLLEEIIEAFESEEYSPLSVYSKLYEFFCTVSLNCSFKDKNISDIRLIKESVKYLEQSVPPLKSIGDIAEECNVSLSWYERMFRSYFGMSPLEYRNVHRINKMKTLLQKTQITLEEIAEKTGCCDSGYLCRFFKKNTGITPKEYRKSYIMQIKNK